MRTSAPSALASNRLFDEPGTRSMSPNEQKITSGRSAMATALSIRSIGVTQTGQPGPCTSVMSRGSKSSKPLLTMVWVCPPQISMTVQGRVTFFHICRDSCSAAFWSRYSLRNFTEFLLKSTEFFQILEDALRFVLVNHADGEADVNENIFSNFRFGNVGEADLFADAAEVDLTDSESDVASVHDFHQPAWNCETHVVASPKLARSAGVPPAVASASCSRFVLLSGCVGETPTRKPRGRRRYNLLITACPKLSPPSLGGTRWCVCTTKPRDSNAAAARSVR